MAGPTDCVCPIEDTPDTAKYNERHDSYYCEKCDVWLSPDCHEPDCDYCAPRPERPSQMEKTA